MSIFIKGRRADHPDFRGCWRGAKQYVFIFDRPQHRTPTDQQRESWEKARRIVEAGGGTMTSNVDTAFGTNPAFTATDLRKMRKAVRDANPDLKIALCWNGQSYSYSVGCVKKC